jgi:NADH:ubiquinone oxidoreductase subunit E
MSVQKEEGIPDMSVVDRIIARCGTAPDAAIPILLGLQEAFGYLPIEALKYVSERTESRPAQLFGIATFYGQFRMTPVGKHRVRVCHGTACHVGGAIGIHERVVETIGLEEGRDTTEDMEYTVENVACLGCCSLSPVIMIDDKVYGKLTREKLRKVFKRQAPEDVEQ